MRQIFNFFIRNYLFFLFVLLQTIALYLSLARDPGKSEIFFSSANQLSGFYFEKTHAVKDYFGLRRQNILLVEENTKLRNHIAAYEYYTYKSSEILEESQYSYSLGKVIKNSVNRQQNYITLNIGEADGIKVNSAVVSPNGVVGVVAKVSRNYATVVSLLNTAFSLTGELEKTGYYGTISWDGISPDYVYLEDIPGHITVSEGDTVVTSGYSAIFPQGIPIGTVSSIDKIKQNNFYKLGIKTLANFRRLDYVYIIQNKRKFEQDSIEYLTEEEFRFIE